MEKKEMLWMVPGVHATFVNAFGQRVAVVIQAAPTLLRGCKRLYETQVIFPNGVVDKVPANCLEPRSR